jgi:uncharacterized protein (DUF58 family)
MLPGLTAQGRLVVALGALLVALGLLTLEWVLAALGSLVLGGLMTAYLAFLWPSTLLRRQRIEFAWWPAPRTEGDPGRGAAAAGADREAGPAGAASRPAPRALTAGEPFSLVVFLRNRSATRLPGAKLHLQRASVLELTGEPAATAPPASVAAPAAAAAGASESVEMDLLPHAEVERTVEMVARAAGHWFLHGATLVLTDLTGMLQTEAYFPSPMALKVLPPVSAQGPVAHRPRAQAVHDRVGLHFHRRRGLGSDLREIRQHAPGDPFKQIAWKPTARTGRLMVRELESEIVIRHRLIVDASATTREGRPGQTKLDAALALAAALARGALTSGDQVGLVAFDGRVLFDVPPEGGRRHLTTLLDHLLELPAPIDEDLTELSDGELVAQVVDYLRHQEGVDFRVSRSAGRLAEVIDDTGLPSGGLMQGPDGYYHDLDALGRHLKTALGGRSLRRTRASMAVQASTPLLADLRRLARQRGIELPAVQRGAPGAKDRGLAQALERAASGRGARLVTLISDLEGLSDAAGRQPVRRALSELRARRFPLQVIVLDSARFLPVHPGVPEAARQILGRQMRRRTAAVLAELRAGGARVERVGPR